jgi:hypothetical protein
MIIYYDDAQEGYWFQGLHPALNDATLSPFPSKRNQSPKLRKLLEYDRPDIVLFDGKNPILVLERTIEVPSGHNVGQRFARLVAAAQMQIPVVYFGPYAAYKHGGATQGPRYMNLRLFYALENMARIEDTVVTIINWPVDQNYEIIHDPNIRDNRPIEYMNFFFGRYNEGGDLPNVICAIRVSSFEAEQKQERDYFIAREVVNPEQYDGPPDSVTIGPLSSISQLDTQDCENLSCQEVVLYRIGMTYIRSDPYTGMGMLYSYLYCGGLENRERDLVLHFPDITQGMWYDVVLRNWKRKDIRLYSLTADGILFRDGYLPKSSLLDANN